MITHLRWSSCGFDEPPKDMFAKIVKCKYGYALAYFVRDGEWINIYTGKKLPNVSRWAHLPESFSRRRYDIK